LKAAVVLPAILAILVIATIALLLGGGQVEQRSPGIGCFAYASAIGEDETFCTSPDPY
jgi:hypothetical protein